MTSFQLWLHQAMNRLINEFRILNRIEKLLIEYIIIFTLLIQVVVDEVFAECIRRKRFFNNVSHIWHLCSDFEVVE